MLYKSLCIIKNNIIEYNNNLRMGLFRALILIVLLYFIYSYVMKYKENNIIKKIGISDKYLLHIMIIIILLFELLF